LGRGGDRVTLPYLKIFLRKDLNNLPTAVGQDFQNPVVMPSDRKTTFDGISIFCAGVSTLLSPLDGAEDIRKVVAPDPRSLSLELLPLGVDG
jgi:hypothetical protein